MTRLSLLHKQLKSALALDKSRYDFLLLLSMDSTSTQQFCVTSDTYDQSIIQGLTKDKPTFFNVTLDTKYQVTMRVTKESEYQLRISAFKFHSKDDNDITQEDDNDTEIERKVKTIYKARVQHDALCNGVISCSDPQSQLNAENCLNVLSNANSPAEACRLIN